MKAHCCRKFTDDAIIIVNEWGKDSEYYATPGKTEEEFSLFVHNNYDEIEEIFDVKFCPYCGKNIKNCSTEIDQKTYKRIFKGRKYGDGNYENIFLED